MVTAPKGAHPVLIKKYGNRRLYDTTQSRYITLDDLAEIVKSGATVKVVEASTERDLTRQVLTQVILEQQEALDMFPVELLHAVIRVRGTLEQAPFSAFLATATRHFVQSGSLLTNQMATFFGGFPNAGDAAAPEPEAGGLDPVEPPQAPPDPEPKAEPTAAKPNQSSGDIDGLRQRMDTLLGKLGK